LRRKIPRREAAPRRSSDAQIRRKGVGTADRAQLALIFVQYGRIEDFPETTMSKKFAGVATVALLLAGCGGPRDEQIEDAPIAQLNGAWRMINRQPNCDAAYAVIGAQGIYRVAEKGPQRKYLAIKRFGVGPGKVVLLTTGLDQDPQKELSLVLSVSDDRIRLVDLQNAKEQSFKEPPGDLDPADAAYMKAMFTINEQRFALDRCVAS
jgi:hypothetical protein